MSLMLPFLAGAVCFVLPHAIAKLGPPVPDAPPQVLFGKTDAQLLRVRVSVPKAFVDGFRGTQKQLLALVAGQMQGAGWRGVELVTHDPTDEKIFTVLTRGRGGLETPFFKVESSEPVDEPGARSRLATKTTDPGLSEDEVWGIGKALEWETNPKHLAGFAGTLSPHFPVAHGLLAAKARILDDGWGDNATATRDVLLADSAPLPNASAVRRVWHVLFDEKAGGGTRTGVAPQRMVVPALLDRMRMQLNIFADKNGIPRDLIYPEVKRAVCLMALGDDEALAAFPVAVLGLSAASTWNTTGGMSLPHPESLAHAAPPTGEEGFVSPAALQFALAEMKPETAGVRDRARVPALLHDLESQSDRGDKDAMRARAMVEKAEKAIDRRRWIEWYLQELGT